MDQQVTVKNGSIVGMLTTNELAKKCGVSPYVIRSHVARKQLYPSVVIGHGTGRLLFFSEETVVPRRDRGRPRERRDGV